MKRLGLFALIFGIIATVAAIVKLKHDLETLDFTEEAIGGR